MTRVSIVTVSFNQAQFLEQALLSVSTQDYADIEYIVVDPGSTDGSRGIIERYSSKIAKAILRPDRGAADGLNRGFADATGEILGFLNSDDYLLPGAVRRVVTFFESHPTCDIVMGNGFIVDAGGRTLRHVKARDFTVQRYLYEGARFLQQSTFFRKEAYLQSPQFNVENRTCWDGELFVSMVNTKAHVGYIDADLGVFRIHDSSISGSGRSAQYREDCKRIYQQIRGREWTAWDEMLRFFYRCEGFLIRKRLWPKILTKLMDFE